jgi:UDP-N-acetyl-D-mannosaminuronate dehydrogenase
MIGDIRSEFGFQLWGCLSSDPYFLLYSLCLEKAPTLHNLATVNHLIQEFVVKILRRLLNPPRTEL